MGRVLKAVKKVGKEVARRVTKNETTFFVTVSGEGTATSKRTFLQNRLGENVRVTSLTKRGLAKRLTDLA